MGDFFLFASSNIQPLIDNIAKVLQEARAQLAKQINSSMTKAYWQIESALYLRFAAIKDKNQ